MASFFRVLGLVLLLFGLLDFGLRSNGISLHRILGLDIPYLSGRYSHVFEIIYGGITFFVANYLRRPPLHHLEIIDLSDQELITDPYYTAPKKPPLPAKSDLVPILLAFLWGCAVALFFGVIVIGFVPGMDALLFNSEALTPKTRKMLVLLLVLGILAAFALAIFGFRLRQTLSITSMICGALLVGILLSAMVLSKPERAQTIYGADFMKQMHTAMGYPEGLPEGWTAESYIDLKWRSARRRW